jgi:hypothetical protein
MKFRHISICEVQLSKKFSIDCGPGEQDLDYLFLGIPFQCTEQEDGICTDEELNQNYKQIPCLPKSFTKKQQTLRRDVQQFCMLPLLDHSHLELHRHAQNLSMQKQRHHLERLLYCKGGKY